MGLTQKLGTIPLAISTDASNNVGIGGSPSGSYKLEVTGTGRFTGALFLGGSSGFPTVGLLNRTSDTTLYMVAAASGFTLTDSSLNTMYNATPTSHTFNISNAAKMTITSSGNVGIGTSSPGSLLTLFDSITPKIAFQNSGAIRAAIQADSSSLILNSVTGNDIRFQCDSAERMRITSGGNVNIGTTAANTIFKLYVQSDTTTTASWVQVLTNGTNNLFLVRGNGQILTGDAAASPYNNTIANVANLFVASDGTLSRSTASSQRFKENINEWGGNGLDTILSLKPKTFTYKESYYKHPERVMLGLIAEEVAEVSEYLADFENEDGTGQVENVRYATIVVPLIKAIQELSAQNQDLKSRLDKAGL